MLFCLPFQLLPFTRKFNIKKRTIFTSVDNENENEQAKNEQANFKIGFVTELQDFAKFLI